MPDSKIARRHRLRFSNLPEKEPSILHMAAEKFGSLGAQDVTGIREQSIFSDDQFSVADLIPRFLKCAEFEANSRFSEKKLEPKIPQKRFKLQWDRFEKSKRAVLKTNVSGTFSGADRLCLMGPSKLGLGFSS